MEEPNNTEDTKISQSTSLTETNKPEEQINFKITLGQLELINSNTLTVFSEEVVTIEFNDLVMKFAFINDNSNSNSLFSSQIEQNLLTWNLKNFKSKYGEGAFEPIKVGSILGRKLYVSFYVVTINLEKGFRLINYSFYLGEKSDGNI